MRTLVAYVPVLHEGYRRFFEKYDGEKTLFILGDEFIEEVPVYRKDLRRLPPATAKRAIEALCMFTHVDILTKEKARALNEEDRELTFADEEPTRTIAEQYFPDSNCSFEPVFLMWDKRNALEERPVVPDERLKREELHQRLLSVAETEAEKSSDFWRHVGAVLVRGGEVVLSAHNRHLPHEHAPYENGDPRNGFNKGIAIEVSSAIHAEAGLIAEAAKQGIKTNEADMYVTVFPCPPCAKLIAAAGVKNLYCGGGYSVLDGEEILKAADVNIVFVE